MNALVGCFGVVLVTAVVLAVAHFLTFGDLRVDRGSRWICVTVMGVVTACLAAALSTLEGGRLVLAFLAGVAALPAALLVALRISDRLYARRLRTAIAAWRATMLCLALGFCATPADGPALLHLDRGAFGAPETTVFSLGF